MSEFDVLRQDHAVIQLTDESADFLADRMVKRFHQVSHRQQGGSGDLSTIDPRTKYQTGGKGVVKFNPSQSEINSGIRQQQSLFGWNSPDGLPHYVTVEVGRLAGGVGGPGQDNTVDGTGNGNSTLGGGGGGGSFPGSSGANNNPLYYRACAQVMLGTPGTMEDLFWIDVNRGQRFTALASSVIVTAQMNAQPIDLITGVAVVPYNSGVGAGLPYLSGSLNVYATLGVGVAPSLAPVLYTQYFDANPASKNGASAFFVVPPRANFLLPVPAGATLSFFDDAGVKIGPNIAGGFVYPFPLSADIFSIGVTTTSGGNFRLIYQLSV